MQSSRHIDWNFPCDRLSAVRRLTRFRSFFCSYSNHLLIHSFIHACMLFYSMLCYSTQRTHKKYFFTSGSGLEADFGSRFVQGQGAKSQRMQELCCQAQRGWDLHHEDQNVRQGYSRIRSKCSFIARTRKKKKRCCMIGICNEHSVSKLFSSIDFHWSLSFNQFVPAKKNKLNSPTNQFIDCTHSHSLRRNSSLPSMTTRTPPKRTV